MENSLAAVAFRQRGLGGPKNRHLRFCNRDGDLLDEALVEHAGAKRLIAEIDAMEVGDALYDAKIRVLGEQIKHHIKEEEEELFPECESSKMDVAAVGKEVAARKSELIAEAAR